jgi:4-amino-4-deoxy-L-arabinose transferase-like glycosyltransferase
VSLSRSGAWTLVGFFILAVGILIRVSNAFWYPINLGFDAPENWRYIHRLMHIWSLPAPGEDWSTSHPPLFYYLGAALGKLTGSHSADPVAIAVRLTSSAIGLIPVGLAYWLVRRVAPEDGWRAWLAAALLLFLPVQIYMSAMLSEEIIASALISIVIVGTCFEWMRASPTPRPGFGWRALGLGIAGGLAILTKLSGVLVLAAAVGTALIAGLRGQQMRKAVTWSVLLIATAMVVGGWYYARNWANWGYLYPQDLQVHEIMFSMPPGERTAVDYVQVPLSTWTDPQLVNPDLLHSVWGGTYVTWWFDGHRHFLARESPSVTAAGTLILLLALLPTLAFGIGVVRGVRRAVSQTFGPDVPLLLLCAITLAGYITFTWGNPWFAAVKASYLLGLSVPFAYYTSEVLADWTRENGLRSRLACGTLATLLITILVVFTYGPIYWNWAGRGIEWTPTAMEAP